MSSLEGALTDELALRSRLNALVHEQAEAHREIERLRVKSAQPGADEDLARVGERWTEVARRIETDLDAARAELRRQEALVAQLRAGESA